MLVEGGLGRISEVSTSHGGSINVGRGERGWRNGSILVRL